jgi:hypothetical protein
MHDAPFPTRTRETHLAKKALKMRLPIAARHLNPLKTNSLKSHDYQFHTPPQMRLPSRVSEPRPLGSD